MGEFICLSGKFVELGKRKTSENVVLLCVKTKGNKQCTYIYIFTRKFIRIRKTQTYKDIRVFVYPCNEMLSISYCR